MLENLHVKNLALIDEIEMDFQPGLNILTGETGAGKSIILGSVNLALGGRYNADMLRNGARYGLVELTFSIEAPAIEKKLAAWDIFPEDGMIVLTRKLMDGRSVSKINGETVNMSVLKDIAGMLIDIHGQHDHQTLLNKKNHLELLDLYAKAGTAGLKQKVAGAFAEYQKCRRDLKEASLDEKERKREISLAEYEVQEIEAAGLTPGEDEALEETYRRMTESKKFTESILETYQYTSESAQGNASDLLSRAIRSLQELQECDETGSQLFEQLVEIDSLLNDFNRELTEYSKSFEFSEEEFYDTENRLNLLNHLKTKYGNSANDILSYCKEKQERLNELNDYENYIAQLQSDFENAEARLKKSSDALSSQRKKAAVLFADEISHGLRDLNFLDVSFEIRFTHLENYTNNGWDDAEFYISTNPGEPLRPLKDVASGGELSRIMLAVKTVLADEEDTPTLIFDEIDTGISGITAGRVAEKMHLIAQNRQVICITHLPQIAAMADAHFKIEKTVKDQVTKTSIIHLNEASSIEELSRILGGAKITDSIRESAREMKELAKREK